ncbi:MAG: ABC transporter permease [Planctomycetes bacterium]|nr:ABC transporter permease [Planctomycetota bacterium]
MNLATKDIGQSLGRFVLTTLGVGMLLMVVMAMGGIYRGILEDATLLVNEIGTDLWIVQRDTRGPFAELSRVPPNLVHRALAVPGVKSSREFVFHTVQRERRGKPFRMAVLGLSWPSDKGDWIPLLAGRPLRQNHFEMIADASLKIGLGEKIQLGKETYTVVGVTHDMLASGGDGIGFFTTADAQAIQFDVPSEAVRLERSSRAARGTRFELAAKQPSLLEFANLPAAELPQIARPQVSAVMVSVLPGAEVQQVAKIISGWDDVSVFTRKGQRELLLEGTVEKVRRQIGLFRILLVVIAAVIMGLILYTMTLDKIHSIALLKLIGAPNSVILGMILQQALMLGALGYGIAFLAGRKLFPLFPKRVILADDDLLMLAGIVLAISVLASLMGIWKAMKVSPNEALA